jgi:hypothetical protein
MKRLIYQVYVGNPSKLFDECVSSVSRYCAKYNIEHKVQREPILKINPDMSRQERSVGNWTKLGYMPIYEKENAFDLLPQYDQIAIVDSDIYIKDTAPNIFDEFKDEDFGAVIERDIPTNPKYVNKITKYSKAAFEKLTDVNWQWNNRGGEFYNMGLMVLNKSFLQYLEGMSAKDFILQPKFKDFVDGIGYYKWSTDQILLNYFVKKSGMKINNLSWKYNALYTAVTKDRIGESWFVHFFLKDKLPNKGENIQELIKKI